MPGEDVEILINVLKNKTEHKINYTDRKFFQQC